jgi:hypothetical protein
MCAGERPRIVEREHATEARAPGRTSYALGVREPVVAGGDALAAVGDGLARCAHAGLGCCRPRKILTPMIAHCAAMTSSTCSSRASPAASHPGIAETVLAGAPSCRSVVFMT